MKRGETMLDIEMKFNNIIVSNVEKKDLPQIHEWMELEGKFVYEESNLNELNERFLESYISEGEFFLKINNNNELIGIIKGRLEFKNPNEAWIWFFYINDKYRVTSLSNNIINALISQFYQKYGIDIFFTRVIKNDSENIRFWRNMGFNIIRIVKDFYNINDEYIDMLIMKKI
jgi:ribosomal protein S18 acetylase RimI-like enzyme